jgi:hypothetical protein
MNISTREFRLHLAQYLKSIGNGEIICVHGTCIGKVEKGQENTPKVCTPPPPEVPVQSEEPVCTQTCDKCKRPSFVLYPHSEVAETGWESFKVCMDCLKTGKKAKPLT